MIAAGDSRAGWLVAAALRLLCLVAVIVPGCGSDPERLLEEGRALQDGGQMAESIEPLRAFLETAPGDPEASFLLGLALLQTGQPTVAIFPLQQAAGAPDFAVDAGLTLAAAQLQLEAFEEAVRVVSGVIEAQPEHVGARLLRAQANLAMNAFGAAVFDTEWLYSKNPEDYSIAVMHAATLGGLGRFEEADALYARVEELGEESGDVQQAAAGCLAVAHYHAETRGDDATADARFRRCLERYPTNALGLDLYSKLLDRLERGEEASALWVRAAVEAPEDLSLQLGLATRLRRDGDEAAAVAGLERTATRIDSAAAWSLLADFYRSSKRPADAVRALEQAIELEPAEREELLFLKVDLLIDAGRIDEARELSGRISHATLRHMIEGRLHLAEGNPAAALAAFEEGSRLWPNNAGARYWAGEAAWKLGDRQRALSEFRESFRIDQMATNAGARLAQIHMELGQTREALDVARTQALSAAPNAWEAAIIWARAAVAQRDWAAAEAAVEHLERAGVDPATAAAERASLAGARKGPEAAISALESADLALDDPANEIALRALAASLLAAQRPADALARVEAALARGPEVASLHELHGSVLLANDRPDAALAAFEKALALDAGLARAKLGLATVAQRRGEIDRAVALLDEAAQLDPSDSSAAHGAAQILLAAGRREEAETRLRRLVERHPAAAGAANDLAWLLADRGRELELARSLAERAVRLAPGPETLDTLGWAQLRSGDAQAAAATFERALALAPSGATPSIRYRLALARIELGDNERARASLEDAIGAGAFPERDEARRKLAELKRPQPEALPPLDDHRPES